MDYKVKKDSGDIVSYRLLDGNTTPEEVLYTYVYVHLFCELKDFQNLLLLLPRRLLYQSFGQLELRMKNIFSQVHFYMTEPWIYARAMSLSGYV